MRRESAGLLVLLLVAGAPVASGLAAQRDAPSPARAALERGLGFIQADDVRWRAKKDACASCHHGAMSVVAYSEARRAGFPVDQQVLDETAAWTKARFVPPYEATPKLEGGFEIPSLAMPLLTLALEGSPEVLSADDLDRMAKYTLDRQQPDGGWHLQQRPPHPVFESREILATWFYLGLEPATRTGKANAALAQDGREKALAWLKSRPPADTTQAVVLGLLLDVRSQASGEDRRRRIAELLRRQREDGGWGQTPDLASDAYATGQALYALSVAGVGPGRSEVRRGAAFLVATQLPDGSWKMIPRVSPERPASKNLVAINSFGATWGCIGLARSLR